VKCAVRYGSVHVPVRKQNLAGRKQNVLWSENIKPILSDARQDKSLARVEKSEVGRRGGQGCDT
jgi:hypothetical protein